MEHLKDKKKENELMDTEDMKSILSVAPAVMMLNASPNKLPDVELPENVDPVIAEGVRNTITENFKDMGLYTDEYKDFMERAIKIQIKNLMENDNPYSKAYIEFYYEKASRKGNI